jgi:hypothetical protein
MEVEVLFWICGKGIYDHPFNFHIIVVFPAVATLARREKVIPFNDEVREINLTSKVFYLHILRLLSDVGFAVGAFR